MAGLRGRALIAYLLVCVVWGSTYLAIRIGVEHLPPFLFAGVRFLIAGALLGGAVLATGGELPRTAREWKILAIVGIFLLIGGNAIVVWAEQTVASGLASVYVAAGPLWTALFDSIVPGGKTRLTWKMGLGLLGGFLGIVLLAGVDAGSIALQRDARAGGPDAGERVLGDGLGLLEATPDRRVALLGGRGADGRSRERCSWCSVSRSERRPHGISPHRDSALSHT